MISPLTVGDTQHLDRPAVASSKVVVVRETYHELKRSDYGYLWLINASHSYPPFSRVSASSVKFVGADSNESAIKSPSPLMFGTIVYEQKFDAGYGRGLQTNLTPYTGYFVFAPCNNFGLPLAEVEASMRDAWSAAVAHSARTLPSTPLSDSLASIGDIVTPKIRSSGRLYLIPDLLQSNEHDILLRVAARSVRDVTALGLPETADLAKTLPILGDQPSILATGGLFFGDIIYTAEPTGYERAAPPQRYKGYFVFTDYHRRVDFRAARADALAHQEFTSFAPSI